MINEAQPMKSLWESYWRLEDSPPVTMHPSVYDGTELLRPYCTQTSLPPKEQRALIVEWCNSLPSFSGVRTLWFHSKVTQGLFDAACKMKNLERLYIKWSGITDLTPIKNLQNLTHLHLGSAPSAEPIKALSGLRNLVDLEIMNVRSLSNLSFLKEMNQLQSLDMSGDGLSGKNLKLNTLEHIQDLSSLERLAISCVSLQDGSLKPIATLPQLKQLMLSNQFEMEEFAYLAAKIPHVQCGKFNPPGELVSRICLECGDKNSVMLIGSRKGIHCSHCKSELIDSHTNKFNRVREILANV